MVGLRVVTALACGASAFVFALLPNLMILDGDPTEPEFAGVDPAMRILPVPMLVIAAMWVASWWPARSVRARACALVAVAVALISLDVAWYVSIMTPYNEVRGS